MGRDQKKEKFEAYIKNIETADLPFEILPWDLYKFREQKGHSVPRDTAFAQNYEMPYKKMDYENDILLIAYIVPSDPIQLVLKTYNESGRVLSSITINRSVGRSGPQFEGYTIITFNRKNEVIKSDSLITCTIDERGNPIDSTIKRELSKHIYSIDNKGLIIDAR
ncbi:MAG TPA: hypothetical protein PLK12_15365 [Prolixibacteraceae bacterium]|nr:hypothetical protein [Prolixibacteraceae bacterium]